MVFMLGFNSVMYCCIVGLIAILKQVVYYKCVWWLKALKKICKLNKLDIYTWYISHTPTKPIPNMLYKAEITNGITVLHIYGSHTKQSTVIKAVLPMKNWGGRM